jgi:ribosomal protein S18 acetylase RimI-like enzyme
LLDASRVFSAHGDAWQTHGRLFQPFGGGTAELPGWRLMASGLGYRYLNAACVTDPAIADVAAAKTWYEERRLPFGAIVASGLWWPHGRRVVSQELMACEPANFSKAPAPLGLKLHTAAASELEVVVAVDNGAFGSSLEAARAWLGALCGFPTVRVAVGELDGEPVATGYATSCEGEAGKSLYLGGIGVIPSARGRGVAAALVSFLLTAGFEQGCTFAHLQTDSENAARLYGRLGFTHFNGIDIYALD